ncbi:MAG: S8 family serine peptidase [Meiothermus sp.]|uniref:S8 family peptidase n=1 Tax=Meiothermus sp. TaxID=1955249 RepID=UPI0025F5A03A|nr:S8 family serine peptidase [Meiothermus sp.]MCS7067993.1 S8 family serine peptidase [Meiothermus sp.]MDW8424372.1 S8 family serine peptidase [Meiothermus sp.]
MNRVILALVGLLVLAACSNRIFPTSPERAHSLTAPLLDWKPAPEFDKLLPELDYDPSQVVGIFDCPGNQTPECLPNLERIANLAGLSLIAAYGLDSVSGSSLACGKTLVQYRVPRGMDVFTAIQRLQAAAAQVTGRNALYGVNPQVGLYGDLGSASAQRATPDWAYQAVNPARGPLSSNPLVGVLDTGVSPVGAFPLQGGADYTGSGSTEDDFVHPQHGQRGHGTGVAGLIAARPSLGVAEGAVVLPVKTNDARGKGSDVTVARGLCYAASQGARVINTSLGTLLNSKVLELALYDLSQSGVVTVASAGNTRGFSGPRRNLPNYPAAYSRTIKGLIAVGSVSSGLQTSSFATAQGYTDLVAPGEAVYALDPNGSTDFYTGTSFAAPFVAGTLARIMDKNPRLTPSDYKAILLATANPKGCRRVQGGECGAGLLDIQNALNKTP